MITLDLEYKSKIHFLKIKLKYIGLFFWLLLMIGIFIFVSMESKINPIKEEHINLVVKSNDFIGPLKPNNYDLINSKLYALLYSFSKVNEVCFDEKNQLWFAYNPRTVNDWTKGWYMEEDKNLTFKIMSNNKGVLITNLNNVFNNDVWIDSEGLQCLLRQ
jgi:hypothetical protein